MELPYKLILNEIEDVLSSSDLSQIEEFIFAIENSEVIVCFGAGRVGLMMKSFAKRLRHLGKNAFFLEDTTVPSVTSRDLLIIGSGSGSTKSVVTIAQIAKERNIPIACITTNPNAQIPKLANSRLVLKNPQQVGTASLVSSQPMTSLFEQSLLILLDSITLMLMETLGQDEVTMKDRHNVLE